MGWDPLPEISTGHGLNEFVLSILNCRWSEGEVAFFNHVTKITST